MLPPLAHQRRGRARQRDQRVGADVEGEREAVARRVDEAAVELLALGEGDGVDEDVERGRSVLPRREDALDVRVLLDVARLDEGRPDAASASGWTRFSMSISTS